MSISLQVAHSENANYVTLKLSVQTEQKRAGDGQQFMTAGESLRRREGKEESSSVGWTWPVDSAVSSLRSTLNRFCDGYVGSPTML